MLRALIIAASFLLASVALADDFPPGPGPSGVVKATGGVAVTDVFDVAGDVDAFKVSLSKDGRAFGYIDVRDDTITAGQPYTVELSLRGAALPPC